MAIIIVAHQTTVAEAAKAPAAPSRLEEAAKRMACNAVWIACEEAMAAVVRTIAPMHDGGGGLAAVQQFMVDVWAAGARAVQAADDELRAAVR